MRFSLFIVIKDVPNRLRVHRILQDQAEIWRLMPNHIKLRSVMHFNGRSWMKRCK